MWTATAIRTESRWLFDRALRLPTRRQPLSKPGVRLQSSSSDSGFMFDDEVLGISKRFKVSALDASSILSLEKPRVLITGALGQLGQGLARILRQVSGLGSALHA